MTEREKHLLWMLARYHCTRYIIAIMSHSTDKGIEHEFICKLFAHYITGEGGCWTAMGLSDECPKGVDVIHKWTEQHITDNLDQTIGFPIGKQMYSDEIDELAKKLFDLMCENVPIFEKLINKAI